jgi:hypothetical protein
MVKKRESSVVAPVLLIVMPQRREPWLQKFEIQRRRDSILSNSKTKYQFQLFISLSAIIITITITDGV